MISKIVPLHDDSRDCFEDQIVTVASWIDRGHEFMYAQSWGFSYDPFKSNILGECIGPGRERDKALHLLEKYHGIEYKWHCTKSFEESFSIIKDQLNKNMPTVIFINPYWCHWAPGYQNTPGYHNCLAIGYDDKNIYCADGYFLKSKESLPIEEYKQGYGRCGTFKLTDNIIVNIDWCKLVKESIALIYNSDNNIFESMREFSKEIEKSFDLEKEIQGYQGLWYSPIWSQLDLIQKGRKQYSKFLKYIAERFDVCELLPIAQEMEEIGMTWSVLQSILYKSHLRKKYDDIQDRLSSMILELSQKEEVMANSLLDLSKKNSFTSLKKAPNLSRNNELMDIIEIVNVKIDNYFNNNGFSMLVSQNSTADFTGTGQYFLKENISDGRIWNVGQAKYLIPNISEGINDNISCKNQLIEVPKEKYKYLMILGCSEWGNFSKQLKLHFVDGSFEEVTLKLTDWHTRPVFEETIAWEGKSVERTEKEINIMNYKTYLFSKIYKLENCDKTIERISLPDYPNMHIFAISIGY